MTTSSLKTLQAISSGPGADLPIADDLNGVRNLMSMHTAKNHSAVRASTCQEALQHSDVEQYRIIVSLAPGVPCIATVLPIGTDTRL
jgi:hypothetical protein